MVDSSAFFQSKGTYLNASHLAAGDLKVTVIQVEFERVGSTQEVKMVVYFKELPRGLILNRTNHGVLSDAFGVETDDWLDRPVTLYVEKTKFDGKDVDGVRMRVDEADHLPREQRSKPKPLPPLDDEVPF